MRFLWASLVVLFSSISNAKFVDWPESFSCSATNLSIYVLQPKIVFIPGGRRTVDGTLLVNGSGQGLAVWLHQRDGNVLHVKREDGYACVFKRSVKGLNGSCGMLEKKDATVVTCP